MSTRTTIAALLAFLFALFMACSSGGKTRTNVNSKKQDPGTTEAGDPGEGSGEAEGPEGTGETTGGNEAGDDLPYAADHSLYYTSSVKQAFDTYCISCHPQEIPSLTSFESIRNNAEDIKTSLMNRTMPPVGSLELPNAVRLTMVNWILAGPKKSPSSIAFEKPLRVNTPDIGGNAEIKLALSSNTATAAWRLYYTPTLNATTGGQLISNDDTAETSVTVNWNANTVAAGTYFLYAELVDGLETAGATSVGSFRFGLPSIVLSTDWRNGSKAFLSNEDLTYTVQNTVMGKVYTVNLAVKKGTGAYQNIATNETDLTKVTLPGLYTFTNGVDYIFKATLFEDGVEVHSDESLAPVGIATAAMSYATLRTDFIDGKCAECHADAGQSGSYESDVTPDSALAAKIVERLSDAESPMPPEPNALLPANELEAVKLWYWLGADP